MRKYVYLLLAMFAVIANHSPIYAQTVAPDKERRIYLWDVSGSLKSNGMWKPLKEALKRTIEGLKDDSDNLIVLIPFYDEPLDTFCELSDKKGKEKILDIIEQYDPQLPKPRRRTDLKNAIEKFENIVRGDTEFLNYMFLYTDGGHEEVIDVPDEGQMVVDKIQKFTPEVTASGRYIYQFYYLVDRRADPKGLIKELESDSRKFWVIDDINVQVKFVGLEATRDTLDICKDSKFKVNLTKDSKEFKGKITFKADHNKFYNVDCITSKDNSSLDITVTPKSVVSIPEKETIKICGKLEKNENDKEQKYFFLLDSQLEIVCNYKPKEVLIGLDTSEIEYNLSDNYKDGKKKDSVKTIPLLEGSNEFNGEIIFEAIENDLYDVSCKTTANQKYLELVVTPKKEVSYGASTIGIKCKLYEGEKDFRKQFKLKNENITINCINLPKRTINFCLETEKGLKSDAKKRLDLGTTSYYPGFCGKSDSLSCLKFSLLTSFGKAAKNDNASCKLSLCDDNGDPLSYSDFKIVVNGENIVTDSYVLDSKCEKVDFEIVPSKSAKSFTFKGYIIISDVKNADEVNGCKATEPIKILSWRFEHDRKLNPLLLNVVLLLLVLFAAIIVYILKHLKDLYIRNRKPKFCGGKLGLHFYWTVMSSVPNVNLFYNGKYGPNVLGTEQKSLAIESYIHTYLLSEICVEKIVLVSGTVPEHEKPKGQFGWILYVGENFQNHTCKGGVINKIVIRPQEKQKVKVDVYTSRTTDDKAFNFSLDMGKVKPYDSEEDIFDGKAIKLEVYRFKGN